MQVDLRPRTLGENLGLAFRLFGAHFPKLFAIQALAQAPVLAMQIYLYAVFVPSTLQNSEPSDAQAIVMSLSVIGTMVLTLLLMPLATGATTLIVAGSFTGQSVGLGSAFATALRRFFPLIGYAMVSGVLIAFGLIGLLIGAYVVFIFLFLGSCVVILEDETVLGSIRRSFDLVKKDFFEVLGLHLLLYIISASVAGAVSMAFVIMSGSMIEPDSAQDLGSLTMFQAVQWLVGVVVSVLGVVAPVVIYFSQRAKHDGFDVEQLSALVDEIEARHGS